MFIKTIIIVESESQVTVISITADGDVTTFQMPEFTYETVQRTAFVRGVRAAAEAQRTQVLYVSAMP